MKSPQEFASAYQRTVRERDLPGHLALYSNKILAFDQWGDWQVQGMGPWERIVEEWFGSIAVGETVEVDFLHAHTLEAPDLAYFTAIAKFAAHDAQGKVIRYLHSRFTAVMRVEKDEWKVIHQHTSCPIDDSLKGQLQMP